MYADWKDTFNGLSDANAGKLAKLMWAYINDENPEPQNEVVAAAFVQIKLTLKRDLKKWEDIKKKRSDAGKASAEKKKQDAAKPTSVDSVEQKPTNPTVIDNDSVNVNDNVIKIEQNFEVLESQEIWKDKTMMALKLDSAKFKIAFDAFKAQHIMAGQVKPLAELMDHFSKWYPKAKDNLFQTTTKQTYDKI